MMPLAFNAARDTRYAIPDDRFKTVLHIFDANWHGIRSAAGAFPGHKLAIDSKTAADDTGLTHITGLIFHHGITRVCYQAYSPLAHHIAQHLHALFGDDIQQFFIGHVNSAQLEFYYEMDRLAQISAAFKAGILNGIASVKPDFDLVFPGCFKPTIINLPPHNIYNDHQKPATEPNSLFLPLETGWRKNLWTNVIAALSVPGTTDIYSVNWPKGLDALHDLSRVSLTGFLDRAALFDQMARAELVLNMTLAECQPMTQLEAMAVGTPALMGPLGLTDLQDDWSVLCEVGPCDTPAPLTKAATRVKALVQSDPKAVSDMIASHLSHRTRLGLDRLAEFLYV